MSRQNTLCHDRVWPNEKVFCCNIVGQAGKIFCRDRVFLCRDRVSQGKEKLCHDRVGQGRENFCLKKEFLGRDRAGHDRKLCRTRQGLGAVIAL